MWFKSFILTRLGEGGADSERAEEAEDWVEDGAEACAGCCAVVCGRDETAVLEPTLGLEDVRVRMLLEDEDGIEGCDCEVLSCAEAFEGAWTVVAVVDEEDDVVGARDGWNGVCGVVASIVERGKCAELCTTSLTVTDPISSDGIFLPRGDAIERERQQAVRRRST